MAETDYGLEFLLSLDGYEFRFADGLWVKIGARRVVATDARPYGIKYSLTLHDAGGRRVYGLDNAHRIGRRPAFDHRHIYGERKIVPYKYRGADKLLEDFYREVERILEELGGNA